jgi:hypothetical protein
LLFTETLTVEFTSSYKYIPSPQFGIRTGMCCNCFEEIWMNLVFSAQLEEHPQDRSSVSMDVGG